MADYDIFREQLAISHPSYGHALWGPSPRKPDRPVQVGDVGFILRGKFHRLFNALLPADDPSHELGVPEYHEPLVPALLDHLDTDSLGRSNYCSAGVSVEPDPGYHSGPGDFPQVSFQYEGTRGAAVLSLPVAARREDTLARDDFRQWIVKHIDSWLAFARKLRLGIDQMEEIILVTGCDRTRSWTNVAFLKNQVDAHVSFGVKAEGPDTSINFQFWPENARGAVLRHGPQGTNLPENQCVFIRGFRVARSFWILPRRIKAAADPSRGPEGYDRDPDTEVISIPATTKYRDPLYLVLEYISKQAPDCDMVLAHDDDLVMVNGIGHGTSLETLEPDVMTDLLQRSNIGVNRVLCDLSPTISGPNTERSVVKGAMPTTYGSDPVRDLNNYLQAVNPPEKLLRYLTFTSRQSGPNNQAVHTGTYTFRGVLVGSGDGATIAAAKRVAATQVLTYFHAQGIPG